MYFLLGVLLGLALVVGLAYVAHRSTRCLNGKPHKWQAWVSTGERERGSIVYIRHCLNCNQPERRFF